MPTPKAGYFNAKGEPLPGCTTILSALSGGSNDPLLSWAVKLAKEGLDWRKERERSAQLGTFIHDVLEKYPDSLPPRAAWMTPEEWERTVRAYSDYAEWHSGVNPVVVAQEVQLVSESHQAGGTFDLILRLGDDYVIADHKTGKTLDLPKIAAQLSFYATAAVERGLVDRPIRRGLVLHYTPKGLKPIELSAPQLDHGLELFKHARAAYSLFKTFPRA
jgi:hypothetical protein